MRRYCILLLITVCNNHWLQPVSKANEVNDSYSTDNLIHFLTSKMVRKETEEYTILNYFIYTEFIGIAWEKETKKNKKFYGIYIFS